MVPRLEPRLLPPSTSRAQSTNSTKRSTRSYSSSFEADDERSSTADHESMGPESGAGYRDEPSQYEGEDTRLTSRKELSGWYAYAFAAEVFVICGMGELEISKAPLRQLLSREHELHVGLFSSGKYLWYSTRRA